MFWRSLAAGVVTALAVGAWTGPVYAGDPIRNDGALYQVAWRGGARGGSRGGYARSYGGGYSRAYRGYSGGYSRAYRGYYGGYRSTYAGRYFRSSYGRFYRPYYAGSYYARYRAYYPYASAYYPYASYYPYSYSYPSYYAQPYCPPPASYYMPYCPTSLSVDVGPYVGQVMGKMRILLGKSAPAEMMPYAPRQDNETSPDDGTYPYDGGPDNPVPLPEDNAKPRGDDVQERVLPANGRYVSQPARRARITYPAYGEKPSRTAAEKDRIRLIKRNSR